jgi:hypothetical protein
VTPDDIRKAVRRALGDRSVYWLAHESGVAYSRLHGYLRDEDPADITTANLAAVLTALGLSISTTAKTSKKARRR